MLSTTDIHDLEYRWKKWQIKRIGKYALFTGIFAVVVFGVTYYYDHTREGKNTPTPSAQYEPKPSTPLVASTPLEVENPQSSPKRPSLAIQPVQPQPLPQPLPQPAQRISSPIPLPTIEEPMQTAPLEKKESITISPSRVDIDYKITQRDTTAYLKEKFDTTKNIVFALMLSEEYYRLEAYLEARKWALIANEINPKNERSWILFAMSQAKLNNVDDAIKALEEFLKTNSSTNAHSLLEKLKKGTF